ncbi:MAG: hypothetical protein QNJ71_07075 [Acidimicrobiia bacterium]|nr:hypothetical protein [Acidimicrobiia bacterium]
MEDSTKLASQQLARMRGMTALYHRRFFFDVNLTTVLVLALFVVGWAGVEEAFLLVPVVALIGAVQTAFDSSYLTFARWYAAFLERRLNEMIGERIHVGAELEATYLYELGTPKIVTIPTTGGFTWFSFVTVFYTVIGAAAYVLGLVAGWGPLLDAPPVVVVIYLVVLLGLTFAALGFGIWWFAAGESERRLQRVLEDRFGERLGASGF